METFDNIIIGAGLSGIYAACLLARKNESFVILEARNRTGGRIFCPEHQGYFSDLGPSWYWPDIHPKIARLIRKLGLTGYRQYEIGEGLFQAPSGAVQSVRGYPMEPLSWRLSGGMNALIDKLMEEIPQSAVRLNHPVCTIEKKTTGVMVGVGELDGEPQALFSGERIILALPPRLAALTILFTPELSHEMTQAMLRTGTWMAGQAKFCALYEEPFWRESGFSGQAFSRRGPMGEIHDGSNNGRSPYGLTGFLGIPAVQRTNREILIEAVLDQLAVMYGKQAERPTAFFYQDWARERYTATKYDQPPMYEHPLYHPPAGRSSIWDGAVCFAGTETADSNGGYLEGALSAAERAIMIR